MTYHRISDFPSQEACDNLAKEGVFYSFNNSDFQSAAPTPKADVKQSEPLPRKVLPEPVLEYGFNLASCLPDKAQDIQLPRF